MRREDFRQALALLERSGVKEARFLGGEPTLHPEFPEMVAESAVRGFRVQVFSNGLMPEAALESLARLPEDQCGVLLNLHHPNEQSAGELATVRETCRRLNGRITPGVNLHSPAMPMEFVLEWIAEFGMCKRVRLGLAHPQAGGTNACLAPKHYRLVGERLTTFAREAMSRGVALGLDCGFVPCMFPPDFFDVAGVDLKTLGVQCGPVPDILPDMTAIACYALGILYRMPVADAATTGELRQELGAQLCRLRQVGIFRACAMCEHKKTGICKGGCLAAALGRLRPSFSECRPSSGRALHSHPSITPGLRPVESGQRLLSHLEQPSEFMQALVAEHGARQRERLPISYDCVSRRLHAILPVFAVESWGQSFVYVPGMTLRAERDMISQLTESLACGQARSEMEDEIMAAARAAQSQWEANARAPVRPVCLNLHLPFACNLGCVYCFARPAAPPDGNERLDGMQWNEAAISKVAEEVAANCAEQCNPFRLVVQGAGEPTLQWEHLVRTTALTRKIAARWGIGWFGHVTTNGQCSRQEAEWLANEFNSVTLSCDGPPSRQNKLRPRRDGAPSAEWIERTAGILRGSNLPFSVRATLDLLDAEELIPLAGYVRDGLGAAELRIECAFRQPAPEGADSVMVDTFVTRFIEGRDLARARGLNLNFAGVRPNELHGPYCDPAKDVVRVTISGKRLTCFLHGVQSSPDWPRENQGASADPDSQLRKRAFEVPNRCAECFNQYHCAKSCPDQCPWIEVWGRAAEIRCRIQRGIALDRLKRPDRTDSLVEFRG